MVVGWIPEEDAGNGSFTPGAWRKKNGDSRKKKETITKRQTDLDRRNGRGIRDGRFLFSGRRVYDKFWKNSSIIYCYIIVFFDYSIINYFLFSIIEHARTQVQQGRPSTILVNTTVSRSGVSGTIVLMNGCLYTIKIDEIV